MSDTAPLELAKSVLDEYGNLTRQRMAERLRREALREQVYALASDYPLRGGRALRASLCIATARIFGATIEDAIDTAVSLELLHSSFLVHDDIEDESLERRGRPTLHVLHGVPTAINVGDALAVIALQPLLENRAHLGRSASLAILQEATRMARESVEGQALELSWRQRSLQSLDEGDYLRMVLKKTCWYTVIYPCRVGAIIGRRLPLAAQAFVRFGFFLGAAFQIQDDTLNLAGDPQRYGKEPNGDLLEGKRTLILLQTWSRATPRERGRMTRVLTVERKDRTHAEVAWLRDLISACGAIEYARTYAHRLAGAARYELERAFGALGAQAPARDLAFVRALPAWMLERR